MIRGWCYSVVKEWEEVCVWRRIVVTHLGGILGPAPQCLIRPSERIVRANSIIPPLFFFCVYTCSVPHLSFRSFRFWKREAVLIRVVYVCRGLGAQIGAKGGHHEADALFWLDRGSSPPSCHWARRGWAEREHGDACRLFV